MRSLFLITCYILGCQIVNGQTLWSNNLQTSNANKLIAPDGSILIQSENKLDCLSSKNGALNWSTKLSPTNKIDFISPVLIALKKANSVEMKDLATGATLLNTEDNYDRAGLINLDGEKIIIAFKKNSTDIIFINRMKNNFVTKNLNNGNSLLLNYHSKDLKNTFLMFDNGVALINLIDQKVIYHNHQKDNNTPTSNVTSGNNVFFLDKKIAVLNNSYLTLIDSDGNRIKGAQLPNNIIKSINVDNKLYISHYIGKKKYGLSVYDLNDTKLLKSKTYDVKGINDFTVVNEKIYTLFTNNVWGGSLKAIDPFSLEITNENPIMNSKNNFTGIITTDNGLGLVNYSKTAFLNLKNFNIEQELPGILLNEVPYLIENNDVFYFQKGFIHKRNRYLRFDSALNALKLDFKMVENDNVRLEKSENGFVLVGNQSISSIDHSGNIKFSHYYPAPGESTGKVLGNILATAASAYLATDAGTNAAKTQSTYQKNYWENEKKSYEDAAGIFGEAVTKRYSKSFNDINTMTMVTKSVNSSGFRIIKISKSTGDVAGELAIDTRQPDYLFDAFESVIYIFSDKGINAVKI